MSPTCPRPFVLAATASWLLLAVITWRAPQGLHFFDPVIQMLALRQHEAGVSPSWNVFMRVDPQDVSRDIPEFITWWPPSTQALSAPLRAVGLTPAATLRTVTLVALLIGAIGWARWFAGFDLPRSWLFTLAAAIPWLRYASAGLFRYSAETLAFATAPWILLGLSALLSRGKAAASLHWFSLGLFIGLSYLFKYSTGLTAACALGAAWLWCFFRDRPRIAPLLVTTAAAALIPLAWHFIARYAGSLTPVGHADPTSFDWMGLAFLFANPALALADAFGPLFYLIVFPGWGPLASGTLNTLAWLALPAGLLLAVLLVSAVRQNRDHAPTWLATLTLATVSLLVFALWFVADVSHEPRIIAPAALATLPIVLAQGRRTFSCRGRITGSVLVLLALVFIALPLIWGPLYVFSKTRQSLAQRPATTGLALPAFEAPDLPIVLRQLQLHAGPRTLWVVPNPELALELPGRAIYLRAGRSIAEDLRNSYDRRETLPHWRTTRPIDLAVLHPSAPTPSAALPPILAAAPHIRDWQRIPLTGTSLTLWRGRLEPAQP